LADGRSPEVGDLTFDEDGRVRVRSGDGQPIRFAFAYRGADFAAQVETAADARLILSAELGKVPYSMEQGSSRQATQRIVEATADLPGGRIEISESQDMSLRAAVQLPRPLTPAGVMAAITSLLLDFGPYIDLLRKILVTANARHELTPRVSLQPVPTPESS
jgi:hypothetical protein